MRKDWYDPLSPSNRVYMKASLRDLPTSVVVGIYLSSGAT
jgi:hypothetical protein